MSLFAVLSQGFISECPTQNIAGITKLFQKFTFPLIHSNISRKFPHLPVTPVSEAFLNLPLVAKFTYAAENGNILLPCVSMHSMHSAILFYQ